MTHNILHPKQWAVQIFESDGSWKILGPFGSRRRAAAFAPAGSRTKLFQLSQFLSGAPRVLDTRPAPDLTPKPLPARLGYFIDELNGVGATEGGYDITQDSSGRFVVASTVDNGSGAVSVGLWRFAEIGNRDTSFGGGDGLVKVDVPGTVDAGVGVAIDPTDDSIVVLAAQDSGSAEVILLRFTDAGVLDTIWGTSGKVVVATGTPVPRCLNIESDGDIIAGYNDLSTIGKIERLTAAGASATTVDLTTKRLRGFAQHTTTNTYSICCESGASYRGAFANVTTGAISSISFALSGMSASPDGTVGVAVDGSGNTFMCGQDSSNADQCSTAKFDGTMTLDSGWGTSGETTTTDAGWVTASFQQIIPLSGGDVIAAGWATHATDPRWVFCRFDSSGSLVSSYGTSGISEIVFTGDADTLVYDAIDDGSSGIVVCGYHTETSVSATVIGRTDANTGALDPLFGRLA